MNIGPSISVPTNFDGDPIPWPIVSYPAVLTVQANDPDDEFLTFRWSVPRATDRLEDYRFTTDAGDWVSVLSVPEEYLQTGDTITCTVTDQAQPQRNFVEIKWEAEIL